MSVPPDTRPLYMISVAAQLAGMHPQTLRVYERKGLVSPRRTARNTRLYSQADVERLLHIQQLSEHGINLAGIERVLELEVELAKAQRRIAALEAELVAQAERFEAELEEVRRGNSREIVQVRRVGTSLAQRIAPVVRRNR